MTDDHDQERDPTSEAIRFLSDDDVTGEQPPLRFASDDLPHWSESPAGERTAGDDLQAWSSFAMSPTWREDSAQTDLEGFGDVTGELPLRITDPTIEDDFFAVVAPEPAAKVTSISTRQRATPPGAGRRSDADSSSTSSPSSGAGGRNMPVAVGVGVALAAIALALFKAGPRYALILVVAILVAAAVEFFDAARRGKYQPAVLLGIVAVGVAPVAAYHEGERGILLVVALATVASLIWFVVVDTEARATSNIALTILGVGWVGVLGSYAGLILTIKGPTGGTDGIGILFACVVGTVAHDVFALAGGSVFGRSPLAPKISPNKTWEGLICGMVGAFVAPVLLSNFLAPWKDDWKNAAYLGIAIAVLAPLGDLAESLVKRDLGVKDMGTLLPAHGGIFDRFDALLFTLPATWYLTQVVHLS